MLQPKSYEEAKFALGEAKLAWEKLIDFIRTNYTMDELYTEGKSTGKLNNYCNELKFRRGGKTLITLYARDGFFIVSIVLGKTEREVFDRERENFSEAAQTIYDQTQTYHDGKWLGFEIRDDVLIDDITRLLNIKRKPNREEKHHD